MTTSKYTEFYSLNKNISGGKSGDVHFIRKQLLPPVVAEIYCKTLTEKSVYHFNDKFIRIK